MPIEFSQQAERSFSSLEKSARERIGLKLVEIGKNPGRYIEGLTGLPFDKIRIGDYRLFVKYDAQRDVLFIVDIRHRKNAYK